MIIDLDGVDVPAGAILEQIFDDIHTVYRATRKGLEVIEHIVLSDWSRSVKLGHILKEEIYRNGVWIYHGVENPE